MRHEDRPNTITEAVQAAPFPVYGFTDYPLTLSVSRHGLGISHLSHLMSVTLTFASPRHSVRSQNIEITSVDAASQRSDREHMVFVLEEPSEDQFFNGRTGIPGRYHFSEEKQKQAGNPGTWEGMLSLANTVFSGKLIHWRHPLQVSAFLLKSQETILIGNACGLSNEELMQFLEGLQIINHQDNLLKQYQYEFENYPSR